MFDMRKYLYLVILFSFTHINGMFPSIVPYYGARALEKEQQEEMGLLTHNASDPQPLFTLADLKRVTQLTVIAYVGESARNGNFLPLGLLAASKATHHFLGGLYEKYQGFYYQFRLRPNGDGTWE